MAAPEEAPEGSEDWRPSRGTLMSVEALAKTDRTFKWSNLRKELDLIMAKDPLKGKYS